MEKAQQDPQNAWFFTGVTAPFSTQFMLSAALTLSYRKGELAPLLYMALHCYKIWNCVACKSMLNSLPVAPSHRAEATHLKVPFTPGSSPKCVSLNSSKVRSANSLRASCMPINSSATPLKMASGMPT